jgi:2-oxoglutarate ferredoxin oxidoreductase subunit alpha
MCESLIGYFEKYRHDSDGKARFAAVQAEDELASIGMVLGAGWAGARSITATSGPGISLMSEFAGLAYFAEIPSVIVNVARMGPSTGLPTRTNQGDLISCVTLSHGDTKQVTLIPGTPEECYDFTRISFDLAEQLQTLILVLMDLDSGMNIWNCRSLPYPTESFKRGKVLDAEQLEKMKDWGRYKDVDGDGIPYRTLPGTNHSRAAYFTRGTGHTEYATYSEKADDWKKNMDRLNHKWDTARKYVPKPIVENAGNKVGVIAYGTTDLCMRECRDQLQNMGIKTDYLRIRAVPFTEEIKTFVSQHDRLYVIDQNRDSQMHSLLKLHLEKGNLADKLVSIRHYDGTPVDARSLSDQISQHEKAYL